MSEIRSQATPARDELAEAVFDLLTRVAEVGTSDRNVIAHGIAMGLEDAGWSKPRMVNSAAELDALPVGSVITTGGVASIALTDLNQQVRVWDAGHGAQCTTDRLTFPATVLFTPGDAG
ncbi:hypothetical protein BKP42_36200 [Rhodococcus erythropolis]|uniref:hypothetical protein n=1 Tax=Rhodococcus erythropolis TaxID=1833 RepID=UPI000BB3BE7A|nr:hypothetical protein [Rhodococcus erythropolis]PBI96960.1 hypothetical protein BKP42_36200 [Rhodococcus erythropolis]